jgi:hypothetical protein
MKHKTVVNYEIPFLFFCDAPFCAGFGPGSGVSAVLLVDRASKQRGPMQRVTDKLDIAMHRQQATDVAS